MYSRGSEFINVVEHLSSKFSIAKFKGNLSYKLI